MEGLDPSILKEFTGLGISGALLVVLFLLAKGNWSALRDISKEHSDSLKEIGRTQAASSEKIAECLKDVAIAQEKVGMHLAENSRAIDRLAHAEKP